MMPTHHTSLPSRTKESFTLKEQLFRLISNKATTWEQLKQLLHKGAFHHLNDKNQVGDTPIQMAIQQGLTDLTKQLAHYEYRGHRVDMTVLDSKKNTLLHLAAEKGDLDLIKVILKINQKREPTQCIQLNSYNEEVFSFLDVACVHQSEHIMHQLLNDEYIVNAQKNDPVLHLNRLHCAAQCGDQELVKAMIKNEPKLLYQVDIESTTVLHRAICANNVALVAFLVNKAPRLLSMADTQGLTPSMLAVELGNIQCVKTLWAINKGVFDVRNSDNQSVLSHAMFIHPKRINEVSNQEVQDKHATMQFIIQQFEKKTSEQRQIWFRANNENNHNNESMTPLMYAVLYNNIEGLKLLIETFCKLSNGNLSHASNIGNQGGNTPLHSVIQRISNYMHSEKFYLSGSDLSRLKIMLPLLLEKGANINIVNHEGMTARRHLENLIIPILYQYTFPGVAGPVVRFSENEDVEEAVKSRVSKQGKYLLNESLQMLAIFHAYSADLDESLAFDRGKLKSRLDDLTKMLNDTQSSHNIPSLFELFRQAYVIGNCLYAERSSKNRYKEHLNFKPTDKQGVFPIEDEVVDILWIMQQNGWFDALRLLLVEKVPNMPTELMDQITFNWFVDTVRSDPALGAYTYASETKLNTIFTAILNNRSIFQFDPSHKAINDGNEVVQEARRPGLR